MSAKEAKANKSVVIQAAGGLAWRDTPRGKEIAVIHRGRYGDWSLPKGKLRKGETWEAAALREVSEETNCQVRLDDFAGCTCYQFEGKPKIVLFWHMSVIEEHDFEPNDEIDMLAWLSVETALARLSYTRERALLKKNQIKNENKQNGSPL